jgi:uncharacterized repeat protein (TIGR01451 family)
MAWWESWNNSATNDSDWPVAVDVDTDGNVYFLIKSDFNPGTSSAYAAVIHKYDPDGNLLWDEIGSTAYPNAQDIDVDDAGNAHVLEDGRVSTYSSANGALLCSGDVEYLWDDDGLPTNPTFLAEVEGVDIEVAPDGSFYLTGTAEQRHWFWTGSTWDSEVHDNFFTAKYDSDCNLIWSDEYGSYEDEDQTRELVFDDDGNILVTGPSGSQLTALKYSPDGTRTGTYHYSHDDAGAFHIDGEYAYVIESPPLALRKYLLSTGAEQWNIPLDGLLTANDIVVDPSGIFYLSGSVDDVWAHQPVTSWFANDMVLIKFSQEDAPGDTDLSVTKSDSLDPVMLGDQLTYTITVMNNGPNQATSVQVIDSLPATTTFVSSSPSQGTCSEAICDLGTLESGAMATIDIVVSTTAVGMITNTCNVTAAETDPDMSNNSATENTLIEEIVVPPGDVDGDGDIDWDDLMDLLDARGEPATGPDDPRDLDGDGIITVMDARILVTLCDRPGCATE